MFWRENECFGAKNPKPKLGNLIFGLSVPTTLAISELHRFNEKSQLGLLSVMWSNWNKLEEFSFFFLITKYLLLSRKLRSSRNSCSEE